MRRWPRPAKILVKVIVSLIVIVGWPILATNVATGAWDMATLRGCVDGYVQIQTDHQLAGANMPDTADPKVLAAYVVESEVLLEERVGALWCPISVQDDQRQFVSAHRSYRIFINLVAIHGLPKDEQALAIFWTQYGLLSDRAAAASAALDTALVDEYKRQNPAPEQAAQ